MDIVGRKRQESALAGLTLNAVLTHETDKRHQARTLFDIIQDDKGGKGIKKPWKSFKPKIKIGKTGSNWKSTVPIPACDVVVEHTENETITHTTSNRFADVPNIEDSDSDPEEPTDDSDNLTTTRSIMMRGNSIRTLNREPVRMMMRETVTDDDVDEDKSDEVLENEEKKNEDGDDEMAAMVAAPKEPRVKMSLMSLLSERGFDREDDNDGYAEEEEEEEEEDEKDGGVSEFSNCCVCMVKHRGTPFVPCGHTFCRLCSKELVVQRGSCPICTNYILEFLHIF